MKNINKKLPTLNRIEKSKYFVSGIVVGLGLLSFGAYAATSMGSGIIGSLFEKVGIDYRLVGSNIKTATVTGLQVQNFSIEEEDLGPDSVSTSKIINGTILEEDLANNSISTTKIINGTILEGDLANNSISTNKIINGTILEEDLAFNSISTSKIINGTILEEDLALNSITSANIKNGTIEYQDLAFNVVNSNDYVPVSNGTSFIDSSITQNGTFIGIGIPNPTSKLDVSGKIKGNSLVIAGKIKGESSLIENLNVGGVGGPGRITGLYRGNNTIYTHLISQNINPSGIAVMQVRGVDGSYVNSFGNVDAPHITLDMHNSNKLGAVRTTTKDLAFQVWDGEKMRIKDNGNIGMGTTNPTNKLQVEGNVSGYNPTANNHLATKAYVDTLFQSCN